VRRLLLAASQPPEQRWFHHWWSTFRRRHQATARRCHATSRTRAQPQHLAGMACTLLPSTTRDLDDALWAQIAEVLPAARRRGDKPPLQYRILLSGILWIARTGAAWHDLPAEFGSWEIVKAAYYRWKQHGQWSQVLTLLQTAETTTT
jgi:transposase